MMRRRNIDVYKRQGKNPWAMALSFQKLKKLQEEAGAKKSSKLNQLFSTHPDLEMCIRDRHSTYHNVKRRQSIRKKKGIFAILLGNLAMI